MKRDPAAGCVLAPEDLRALMRAIVRDHGAPVAAQTLGFSRHVFNRILAGLPVRPGTVALLRERLAALESEGTEALNQ